MIFDESFESRSNLRNEQKVKNVLHNPKTSLEEFIEQRQNEIV